MITPRQTRLLRVPDLGALQRALIDLAARLTPLEASDAFIVVPTRAAGRQLRRTLGRESGVGSPFDSAGQTAGVAQGKRGSGLVIGTRTDLYAELASRLPAPPRLINPFERDVFASAIAREVEAAGIHPPFALRASLMTDMLALYDEVRRQGKTIADFERNIGGELELSADSDRGAAQLLEQTRFLAALFRGYEERLPSTGADDEHTLRDRLLTVTPSSPMRHVTITVADRTADPEGLWPVDFTLLARLPGLDAIDVIATEGLLAAGWLERVHAVLPEMEEINLGGERHVPILVVPREGAPSPAGPLVHHTRDREEELAQVARRILMERRAGRAPDLERTALVVRRPLPYLYLAGEVLGAAGIPFEALDTLPLAAEPYAAATDVALDVVVSGYSRVALVALLRSPHFEAGVDRAAVSALDRALAEARYAGGLDRLTALAADWPEGSAREAARAALQLAQELTPLEARAPISDHLDRLRAFLEAHQVAGAGLREPPADIDLERQTRVRAAILQTLDNIANAHRDDPAGVRVTAADLTTTIRRWLGAATVATAVGASGVQIVDAQAARFGAFEDVQLVGLIEGEWPERPRRSIFYPASLLALLQPGPATAIDMARRERDGLRAARAAFRDLLGLARQRVRVSTFILEADAVVEPSTLIDDVAAIGLPLEPEVETAGARVFPYEALALEPPDLDALAAPAAAWARLRLDGQRGAERRFQGEAGPWVFPRVSVSRVDRYLDCPFRFYASEVLRLEEEPEDEDQRTPLERGRFLHEIFETFFREWQLAGRRRITPADLPRAREHLIEVCERALVPLPPTEAALERARLLGSAAGAGIVERVLTLEAEREDEVRERFIEYPVEGALRFRTAAGGTREVALRAKIDRVDLLGDGGFRLIDYKSKYTPDVKRKVQLPIYAAAVRQRLSETRGADVPPREALYLSLEGDRAVVALKGKSGTTLDELMAEAEDRFIQTLDAIAAGHFPPRPTPRSLCNTCPYDTVCRKAFVEEGQAGDD